MSDIGLLNSVPGVYVKEVDTGSRPILGVGTSTAGFIGFLRNAPPLQTKDAKGNFPSPKNVSSFESFSSAFLTKKGSNDLMEEDKETIGDLDSQIFIEAVKGYFANGGSTCYVLPVNSLKVVKTTTPAPNPTSVSVDQIAIALNRFETIDDVSVMAIPFPSNVGETDPKLQLKRRVEIRGMLIDHCVQLNDRFAVIDGEEDGLDASTHEPTLKLVYPSVNSDGEVVDRGRSSDPGQGAVYYPWLFVNGRDNPVPPSGHIAGLYARVDAERGVFKAPANEFLRGTAGLTFRFSPKQQGQLNPDGVNVIRMIDGAPKVYGARTIKTVATKSLEYVSTRRYLNFLRKSIEKGTEFVVFEPNSIGLWQRVIRTVGDFLYNQWTNGGLFGATPKEAFFVRCDRSINPESEQEQGRLNIDVGVSIVKPAEFVVFRLAQQVPKA